MIIVFIAYLVILIGIVAYSARRSKTNRDFVLGGKKISGFSLALSERATGESAWLLLGLTGHAYAEGMSHLIHAARYNANMKYFVHNNQVFALTVGQPTPTTEIGFKDKTNPLGVKVPPLNPIKLMLSAGATFVARVFADSKQIYSIMEEAMKHKGFAFIEVLQPCIVFHADKGYKEQTYSLQKSGHDKTSFAKAMRKAGEFDYNPVTKKTKIPLGIFYQEQRETFEEQIPSVNALKKQGKSWKDIKR